MVDSPRMRHLDFKACLIWVGNGFEIRIYEDR